MGPVMGSDHHVKPGQPVSQKAVGNCTYLRLLLVPPHEQIAAVMKGKRKAIGDGAKLILCLSCSAWDLPGWSLVHSGKLYIRTENVRLLIRELGCQFVLLTQDLVALQGLIERV